MDFALYAVRSLLFYLIEAIQIAMLLRAVFSWFDPQCEGRFSVFLLTVTEPIIYPVRVICDKRGWFTNTPIDIPFLITLLLLMGIQTLVGFV